MEFDLLLQ